MGVGESMEGGLTSGGSGAAEGVLGGRRRRFQSQEGVSAPLERIESKRWMSPAEFGCEGKVGALRGEDGAGRVPMNAWSLGGRARREETC